MDCVEHCITWLGGFLLRRLALSRAERRHLEGSRTGGWPPNHIPPMTKVTDSKLANRANRLERGGPHIEINADPFFILKVSNLVSLACRPYMTCTRYRRSFSNKARSVPLKHDSTSKLRPKNWEISHCRLKWQSGRVVRAVCHNHLNRAPKFSSLTPTIFSPLSFPYLLSLGPRGGGRARDTVT